jgi:hypothetical protein
VRQMWPAASEAPRSEVRRVLGTAIETSWLAAERDLRRRGGRPQLEARHSLPVRSSAILETHKSLPLPILADQRRRLARTRADLPRVRAEPQVLGCFFRRPRKTRPGWFHSQSGRTAPSGSPPLVPARVARVGVFVGPGASRAPKSRAALGRPSGPPSP